MSASSLSPRSVAVSFRLYGHGAGGKAACAYERGGHFTARTEAANAAQACRQKGRIVRHPIGPRQRREEAVESGVQGGWMKQVGGAGRFRFGKPGGKAHPRLAVIKDLDFGDPGKGRTIVEAEAPRDLVDLLSLKRGELLSAVVRWYS